MSKQTLAFQRSLQDHDLLSSLTFLTTKIYFQNQFNKFGISMLYTLSIIFKGKHFLELNILQHMQFTKFT